MRLVTGTTCVVSDPRSRGGSHGCHNGPNEGLLKRGDDLDSTRTNAQAGSRPPIERLAADWLAAEEAASSGSGRAGLEDYARIRSEAYDEAIREASAEDLLIAWEAARVIQGEQEIGSAAWASARRVSELLRSEYLAVHPNGVNESS